MRKAFIAVLAFVLLVGFAPLSFAQKAGSWKVEEAEVVKVKPRKAGSWKVEEGEGILGDKAAVFRAGGEGVKPPAGGVPKSGGGNVGNPPQPTGGSSGDDDGSSGGKKNQGKKSGSSKGKKTPKATPQKD